jgi:hypothetical protein
MESFDMVGMVVVDMFVLVDHDNKLLVDDIDVDNRVGIHIEKDIDKESRLDVGKVVDSLEVHRVSIVYRIVGIAIYLILVSRFYFHRISNIF